MTEADSTPPSDDIATRKKIKPTLIKRVVGITIAILIVGGFTYTATQTDIFYTTASDSKSSEEIVQDTIKVKDTRELDIYNELGSSYIEDGEEVIAIANDMDCEKYTYEWESPTLKCDQGISQLTTFGNTEISVGEIFQKIALETATRAEIATAIAQIDKLNESYSDEIISYLLEESEITTNKQANANNKTALQSVLNGN